MAKELLDERRGIHLLSPGDVVRFEDCFYDVTGVYLANERYFSTVGMLRSGSDCPEELRLPLSIVEGACEVYLRSNPTPRGK